MQLQSIRNWLYHRFFKRVAQKSIRLQLINCTGSPILLLRVIYGDQFHEFTNIGVDKRSPVIKSSQHHTGLYLYLLTTSNSFYSSPGPTNKLRFKDNHFYQVSLYVVKGSNGKQMLLVIPDQNE